MIASGIYIFNDVCDVSHDRLHPVKHRPIPAGDISPLNALIICIVVLISGLGIAYIHGVLHFFLLYIGLNFLYSIKLKHVSIIDIFIISIGFVIRLMIGASVAHVQLSMWIIIMTFLLALFLALSKRKGDLYKLEGNETRPVLNDYTQDFLSIGMSIMGSVVIVCYLMYSTSPKVINYFGSEYVYVNSIFVLFGIFRYLQITFKDAATDNPTKVFIHDFWLKLTIVGWLLSFTYIMYL